MKKLLLAAALAAAAAVGAQESDPSELVAAIEQVTGWTREELVEGLSMLERACSNDCLTAAGRVKWHGPVVSTRIDTNALQKICTHEDGFVYVAPFNEVKSKSVASRLSAAERAAARAEKARQGKTARLEYLLTHETNEIARLCLKYPSNLAGLLYTNEVNTLKTALGQTAGAVVTPER